MKGLHILVPLDPLVWAACTLNSGEQGMEQN